MIKELELKKGERIENLIYEVRGKQVMLDTDLAKLYQVETKRINEAVSRNNEKFPERFCFRITEKEYNSLKSQIATSKGGSRKGHSVFTEQGVAMLATILKSKIATQVSIAIMDAFVAMRKYVSSNLLEEKNIYSKLLEHDIQIQLLKESFKQFEEKQKVNEIFFDGQIYDAYSKIIDIFKHAEKELIIIDNYADSTILDIIKRLNTKVIIITKKNNLLIEQDIEKYNKQYQNLIVKYNSSFHDRYFILDKNIVYHCGASINRIGYKTFSITLIKDNSVIDALISRINQITN